MVRGSWRSCSCRHKGHCSMLKYRSFCRTLSDATIDLHSERIGPECDAILPVLSWLIRRLKFEELSNTLAPHAGCLAPILYLICSSRSKSTIEDVPPFRLIRHVLHDLRGALFLTMMFLDRLPRVRNASYFRPMILDLFDVGISKCRCVLHDLLKHCRGGGRTLAMA